MVTPRYRSIDPERFGLARRLRGLAVPLGGDTVEVGVYEGQAPSTPRVRVYLVDHPPSFDRDGLYGDAARRLRRQRAPLRAARRGGAGAGGASSASWPDVVHGHDWQAGPALLLAKRRWARLPLPKTVFTVHNLAYQGLFPEPRGRRSSGLPRELFTPEGFEFYGQVSFLKAGLALADRITTVSPRYAREIQTPEQGFGLDGVLARARRELVGILNGVDYDDVEPGARSAPAGARYSADDLGGQARLQGGAAARARAAGRAPTCRCAASISRLDRAEGLRPGRSSALPTLLASEDVQYVVLGTGDAGAEERARASCSRSTPSKLRACASATTTRSRTASRRGCDLFLMPSRFEPCGLNQMYSLRYGTLPIVRATGGLDDTIVDFDAALAHRHRLQVRAVQPGRAARDAGDARWPPTATRGDFAALVRRAMAQDFSWDARGRSAYAVALSRIRLTRLSCGDADADLALDVDQLAARHHPPTDGEIDRARERPAGRDDRAGAQLEQLAAAHGDAAELAHDLDRQLAAADRRRGCPSARV